MDRNFEPPPGQDSSLIFTSFFRETDKNPTKKVAKDDIHAKTISLYESLKSDDTRIIQLLLQGAIQTQVNQVKRTAFFGTFLASILLRKKI